MGAAPSTARLTSEARRETLLDEAGRMVRSGHVDLVSIDAVAERAGVSRALIYKHFRNRQDLLEGLFERESARLHDRLARDVAAASTLGEMLRALIRGAMASQADIGLTLATLAASGGRGPAQRTVQRRRDATTLRFFARHAVDELGVDEVLATECLAVGLGAIPAVLARWRTEPTAAHRRVLEEVYVAMVLGALNGLRVTQD